LNNDLERGLLLGCLPLLASYFFDRNSELNPKPVGWHEPGDDDEELESFLKELIARHALACGQRLGKVLTAIERGVSLVAIVLQEDSRGVIRGRLDPPRYLARRRLNVSLPRIYHVLVNRNEPQTPENALVCASLTALIGQLTRAPFARSRAEGYTAGVIRAWAASRLRREPWSDVRRRDSLSRLVRETEQRTRKRQTGNDDSYAALVRWVDEWVADPRRLGADTQQSIVDGLLSFPAGDSFWQKVFEVWCLQQVGESLSRLDWIVQTRQPLHRRSAGPILKFSKDGDEVAVWFQRQAPLGLARWQYLDGAALRGIPDVTLTHSRIPSPLLVDAKYRYAIGDTRAEETYKLLGYAENFRLAFPAGFRGILCFVGEDVAANDLRGPDLGKITLLRCDDRLDNMLDFQRAIDSAVRSWTTI
jgi:hypothetical protein